jgi:hypothetical protein
MGIVLVFDLDQTIVDTQESFLHLDTSMIDRLKKQIRPFLNENIVNLLKRASKLRHTHVSAICLLTNNSDVVFIAAVDSLLRDLCGSPGKYKTPDNIDDYSKYFVNQDYFFDAIMPRYHPTRDPTSSKSVKDVKVMMSYLGEKVVLDDIYFFDDQPHVIDREIRNSIKIVPLFNRYKNDLTNYKPILERLSRIDGHPAELPEVTRVQTLQAVPRASTLTKVPKTLTNPLLVRRSTPTIELNALSVEEPRKFGRNRSNNGEINESEFPPQASIRHGTNLSSLPYLLGNIPKKSTLRPTLSGAFSAFSKGGRRSRRLLKKHRNKTRNRFRK